MSEKGLLPQLFSQLDVTSGAHRPSHVEPQDDQTGLLRDMLTAQDRTNELLEELVGTLTAQQRHRQQEMQRWRDANPQLATNCREAAEVLSEVQVDFLERLTEDVKDNGEEMAYGDFMLTEFVDRYGPRLAHLNGVIQALAQLGGCQAAPADEEQEG
ncbi:hypothetical protein Pla108_28460 [Botrimarina colliarenosi]|uniref:Uncharacterized protein n=1 Tax=Botrimarina colliarenosi TaxID=2528001 RepID=A0A5C6ABV0_9BACT|nr:hypothetical protein [Botrimarina colliarenosi]TWT97069.1 hypothetical protein Pla108_28460 [Botrimarina colliarenosi]